MNFNKSILATALTGLLWSATTTAATVACGDSLLGVRVAIVDQGLPQGLCHAQEGNLTSADIGALGLSQLAKEIAANGDVASTSLNFTMNSARTAGTWAIDSGAWSDWEHLYLGLHFGGGGTASSVSPDSFVVELARLGSAGTWSLSGTADFRATGLSNIYLLARAPSTGQPASGLSVPEPSGLALAALGLLMATGLRRKTAA